MMRLSIILLLISCWQPVRSQWTWSFSGPVVSSSSSAESSVMDSPGGKDDAAAALYKQGYHFILNEEWENARRKLDEVLAKYPSSAFVDDAKYWIAYSLKHTDFDKARTEYKRFIKEYPRSKYIDDAVADLSELNEATTIVATGVGDSNMIVKKIPGGYAYGIGSTPRLAEEQMRRSERQLRRQLEHLGRPMTPIALPPHVFMPHVPRPDENLDDETKVKMKALYALGDTREDEKSYQALKEVALDTKENRSLREAALDALSRFRKFDVLPVYVEVAKRDTSEDLQDYAIDYIGQHGKDRVKTVQTLIDLFRALPNNRTEQRKTVFYSIADIGNDRAVEFLASVAKANDNIELRTEAIYYLGAIGGEKARGALYDIIRERKER